MKYLLIILATTIMTSCSTSLYKLNKEGVGYGVVRYENQEITCYEFLGLYNTETKCKFKDGRQGPVPQRYFELAEKSK